MFLYLLIVYLVVIALASADDEIQPWHVAASPVIWPWLYYTSIIRNLRRRSR